MGLQKQRLLLWTLGFAALLATGCSHGLSSAVRQQVDSTLSMEQLRSNPEIYKDRVVMLGGEIVTTRNLTEGTRLEILQKPLDAFGMPYDIDKSEGRFMMLCDTYLDPAIYAPGRKMTVAGRVLGSRLDKIDEAEYVYPLLSCLETRLWPQTSSDPYLAYHYWGWWDWGPWPGPVWWRPYYYHRHRHPR
jgi:outer membrane lipoprotein